MDGHGEQEQFLRNSSEQQLTRIAANFGRIAVCITERRPDAALMTLLEETQRFCEWAGSGGSGEAKTLLSNLTTALKTWQQVWPRLGAEQEFRLAIAREANLWSRRFQALGKGAEPRERA